LGILLNPELIGGYSSSNIVNRFVIV
jgi:hypothetical protein